MPDIPDRLRPEKVLDLLWIGPRLAVAGLKLTGSTLRGVVGLLDRGTEERAPATDEDHLWTPPAEEAAANGAGALDTTAATEAPVESDEPPREAPPSPLPPSESRAEEPRPSAHVSEEPELVAEIADSGAEEGAGAEVHVDEPWHGYGEMTAQEIVDRLPAEPVEVNAVVELYERAHRRRQMVLAAAEREVRRRSGPGARS